MADAKIITFGELFSATTDVIPDDRAAAVEIEGLDGKDYIKINTTDDEESVDLVSSGTGTVGIGSGFTTPHELLHIANSGTEVGDDAYIKFTTEAGGHGAGDGAHIGLNKTGTFQIAMDDANDILLMQGAAPRLTVNGSGTTTLSPAAGNDGLIVSSGDVGIGTTDPDTLLTLEDGGLGAQYSTDLVMLRNPASAASMINTRTNISFRQQTHGGSLEGSGRIQVGTETNWTGTASTQDSFMGFSISDEGTLTEAMRIDSDGNVGIGTPSPSAQFHLQKDAGDAVVLLQCNDASFGVDEIYGKIDFGNRNFDDRICSIVAAQEAACDSAVSSNGYLAFYTEARSENISEKMRITSIGQVGVGTDTPQGYLHLAAGPRTSLGRLNSDAIGSTTLKLATPADIVDFYDGMKVVFSSNSGGTASAFTTTVSGAPDKDPLSGGYGTFTVASITSGDPPVTQVAPDDYCTTPIEDNYLRFTTETTGHDADDGAFIGIAAANYMDIKTKNTDMYLSAGSGYAPVWISSSGTIRFYYAPYFVNGLYINSVDDSKKIDDGPNGGSSTQMYIGNVNINPTSDRRIKKNIVDTSANALETLDKVRVVDFEWDDPVDTSWNGKNARGLWTGVIAQEVIEHIPYAVNAPRDPQTMETLPDAKKLDENGNEIDELWFMNHGDIVPLLIKAVQELKSEIAQLKEGN